MAEIKKDIMKKLIKPKYFLLCLILSLLICSVGVAIAFATSEKDNDKDIAANFPPEIFVDYGEYSVDNLPDAVINKPYKLFSATAKDVFNNDLYVNSRVYLFYDSENRILQNTENGYFTPLTYGVYTVEFVAIDRWGNRSTELYDFNCFEKSPLSGNVSGDSTVYNAGDFIKMQEISVNNFIGITEVSIKAVLLGNSSVSYDVVDGGFKPLYAGTYKVIYSITDYNESTEASYELSVNAHDNPVWQGTVQINEYLILGNEYVLPELSAYNFADGTPKAANVSIDVTYPSLGTQTLSDERKFTPNAEGDYKIVYKAQCNGKQKVLEYNAQCIDVGFTGELCMEKYFIGDNVSKTATYEGILLSTSYDNASVTFINPISSGKAHLELSIDKDYADNFNGVEIILTDTSDPDLSIALEYSKVGDNAGFFSVCGGGKTKLALGIKSNSVFVFDYLNATTTATLTSSQAVLVNKTVNGEDFNGFKSESVLVSIRFKGVIGQAKINMLFVGNQALSSEKADGVEPDVIYTPYNDGTKTIGDYVTIKRIYIYDVLCPSVECEYYVKTPSGKYVTTVDGVSLSPSEADYTKDYTFMITEYGRYMVRIYVSDCFDNVFNFGYFIESSDDGQVVVELVNDAPVTAKKGDTITVKSFTAEGYQLNELTARVFVITPAQVTMEITDNTFKADYVGEYIVWYYIKDANNADYFDMVCYSVTVS